MYQCVPSLILNALLELRDNNVIPAMISLITKNLNEFLRKEITVEEYDREFAKIKRAGKWWGLPGYKG